MDNSKQNVDQECFFDATDEFPFFDCNDSEESSVTNLYPPPSELESVDNAADDSSRLNFSPEKSSPVGVRLRRKSFQLNRRQSFADDSNASTYDFPVSSRVTSFPREKRSRLCESLKEDENASEKQGSVRVPFGSARSSSFAEEQNTENSTITDENAERVDDSATVDSPSRELHEPSSSFLVSLAGLVIKAISFQVSLMVSFFTFPFWFLYNAYMFVSDPFGMLRRFTEFISGKFLRIWDLLCELLSPFLGEWLKGDKSIWNLAIWFVWGVLWSVYACTILFSFLVFSFVISGIVMRHIVEEPIQMKETLNFDYTKNSPVALVPITSCPASSCGINCKGNIDSDKNAIQWVIPPGHRLQITVSLTLPESEYNRKLGIFQVRVVLLSEYGKALATASHPCMLKFKSPPIRLLLTFFKMVPLIAGYLSESQTINLKFQGFVEGPIPTACLKVLIEQRAEYRSGAGIPEIYSASLILESELPLFKRIIWYWKTTVFIWVATSVFMMELFFALICCRPVIIPRTRARHGSASSSALQNNSGSQR